MPSPEQRSAINPETYLDDVLLWRPPLPVDQFDISDIEPLGPDMAQDVPGYAWERLPRWITQIEDTFKKSGDVPIVCVDLCSSIPLNAQMLRALEFKRSGERGREILKTLFSGDPEYHLEDPDMQSIHMAAARDEKVRRLLNSAIQAVLYTRNSEDMADGDYEPALRHLVGRFTEVLPQKTTSYVMEDGSRNLETRWGICFQSVDEGYTYLDVLANLEHPTSKAVQAGKRVRDASQEYYSDLQGITRKERRAIRLKFQESHAEDIALADETEPFGYELAQAYLNWQIFNIARGIAGNSRYRPARFMSLDIAPRAMIASSSLTAISKEIQETNMFSHAVKSLFDPNQHIASSMFEPLPVPDNTLTFITCYDAWPFSTNFGGIEDTDGPLTEKEIETCIFVAVDRLFTLYQKLTYGGKLVIFPWATYDNDDHSASILRRVAGELSLLTGHGIDRPLFHYAALQELMSESERAIAAGPSAVFDDTNKNVIEALIVEKPMRKLVERHTKALGNRLLIAAQNLDLPDPTL